MKLNPRTSAVAENNLKAFVLNVKGFVRATQSVARMNMLIYITGKYSKYQD